MSLELDSLLDLINSNVREIQAVYRSKNTRLPSIDEPSISVGLELTDPIIRRATDITIAAAKRLIATLSNPSHTVIGIAGGIYGSSLLNVVVESNVTEALKEGDPEGIHVRDLALKVGMNPSKLSRALRYLCARHHLYREVSPDVFANNRISIALDTGKAFSELQDRGPLRYSESKGAAANAGHVTDEMMKGAAVLPEILLDPDTAHSFEPSKTALMKAFGYDGGWWEWYEQPDQKKRFNRFAEAMKNLDVFFPNDMILGLYPWESVPKDGIVVDIGGGLGGTTLPLARAFPDLRFVVQDRPPIVVDAEKYWTSAFPDAIKSGLVKLQVHDFFTPQPVKGAAVYLYRFVLHNWVDSDAIKILQQLHPAMAPHSKLLILDQIVPYTCPVEDSLMGQIPAVLGGNLAPCLGLPYQTDIQMMTAVNSKERTVGEWVSMIETAGFKVESITPAPVSAIMCSLA